MAAIVVVTLGLLTALGLVLLTVHRLRPVRFHIKATITKWVSLDIQMQGPERGEATSASRPHRQLRSAGRRRRRRR